MCGIIGIISSKPINDREWLVKGRNLMSHRGPDSDGIYWSNDKRVGMGHQRLSILDLSQGGHQPMHLPHKKISIVFNGEIYNHNSLRHQLRQLGYTFNSSSDTEVIIAAYLKWGKACVSKLEGMFAFAIYDGLKNEVLLARDRAGEKPLFYAFEKGELRFASELKGLMSDRNFRRQIDKRALDCYLSMGFIPGDICILESVNKLPPAHILSFQLEDCSLIIERYWDLPEFEENVLSESDLVNELEIVLEKAVKRQLNADVPVGVLLSGGVDSSLITAMAARNSGCPKTFTVGFRKNKGYDESGHAQLIAKHFDTDHALLEADDVSPNILHLLAKQYDEPITDSSMIPTFLVSKQIGKHCKVALGGDGGDELFGGYYSASRMASLQQNYSWLPLSLRQLISKVGLAVLPIEAKGRHFLNHLGSDMNQDIPPFMPKFDRNARSKMLRLNTKNWPFFAEEIRQNRIPKYSDAVQRITRFDFSNFMAEDILVKVDRASMLNSVEVRSPFLDVSVIEFAFRKVPSNLKATPFDRKIIFKKISVTYITT